MSISCRTSWPSARLRSSSAWEDPAVLTGRVSGTDLVNPDFAALARAHGAHGETGERDADFPEALSFVFGDNAEGSAGITGHPAEERQPAAGGRGDLLGHLLPGPVIQRRVVDPADQCLQGLLSESHRLTFRAPCLTQTITARGLASTGAGWDRYKVSWRGGVQAAGPD